jgi:hypothetical protein
MSADLHAPLLTQQSLNSHMNRGSSSTNRGPVILRAGSKNPFEVSSYKNCFYKVTDGNASIRNSVG